MHVSVGIAPRSRSSIRALPHIECCLLRLPHYPLQQAIQQPQGKCSIGFKMNGDRIYRSMGARSAVCIACDLSHGISLPHLES